MKKFLFLSAIAVLFAACQSKTGYTISGTVADPMYEGQKVLVVESAGSEMVPVDSTVVTNGKFILKGDTENAVLRFISIGENETKVRSIMVVEPGKINVVYDSAFLITGTALNDVYADFNQKQKEQRIQEDTNGIKSMFSGGFKISIMPSIIQQRGEATLVVNPKDYDKI